ncbi:NADPH:quinone oxidoreductase family protein [Nocardioides sp. Iso805N]|uniref:NADPH:quinone oxidoreductase family protein n=1 Tax=Nocardioides sp. Iso805N TaxID=1283287 RepID=UPI001E28C6FC|nr:NADPH:quinone oxidoreductase family protein [Nocardioides sp. Iso805N]
MTSIPGAATMLAARIHQLGTPEAVQLDTVPRPVPGPGELLVAVHAAAVNFPDTLMIEGRYQTPTPLPFTPGHESAGVVVAIGPQVNGWAVGDRVAVLAPGAFAEYVVASARSAVRVPASIGFADAAATWVCHLTAYHALRSVASVTAGETVLVLGAGGGLGLAAVELAARLGATVVAAASTREKLAAAGSRGATHLVDYATDGLRAGLREAIGPGAVDVVLDPVGGDRAEEALREMRWGGRFITLGYASDAIPRIPLNLVLLKGVTIKGLEVRTFDRHDPVSAARDRAEFIELWTSQRIHPMVGAVFPLEQAREALSYVAERRAVGKTVIEVRAD